MANNTNIEDKLSLLKELREQLRKRRQLAELTLQPQVAATTRVEIDPKRPSEVPFDPPLTQEQADFNYRVDWNVTNVRQVTRVYCPDI